MASSGFSTIDTGLLPMRLRRLFERFYTVQVARRQASEVSIEPMTRYERLCPKTWCHQRYEDLSALSRTLECFQQAIDLVGKPLWYQKICLETRHSARLQGES
jgi:hypothetical protein